MTNADLFKQTFGIYAEEFWAYDEKQMLDWLNADVHDRNVGDTISRRAAIEAVGDVYPLDYNGQAIHERIKTLPSAQPEQRWIPVKTRPMTEEERQEYSELFGYDIEYEDAVMFECKMPDDGQDVWICTKCGNVWQDTCVVEEGIGLEGNGDWLDIVAWMPFDKPEPYRE